MMRLWVQFVLLIAFFASIQEGLLVPKRPKLLVVSYDAFRYDYFNRNMTPFMQSIKQEGTYTDYMKNVFVTKTFANHHTMVTGLYVETHGVVDNEFYDAATGNVTKYSYKLFHYDNSILPIWTINERAGAGRRSGVMMWPGGTYAYQGVVPTFEQSYNEAVSFEDRVDTLISWFTHPTTPINFGLLYIEEPDFHGHVMGIHSSDFNAILRKLDGLTKYLHDRLIEMGLTDINVIHLSDHGMASVTIDRILNLTNYIDPADYQFVGTSPGLHIFPKAGKEEMIYRKLKEAAEETKKFKVFRREEIPEIYHYGNNTRVGPIFVIAEVGYAFQNLFDAIEGYKKQYNITVNDKSEFGLHGYDNRASEMHPMFFARGPSFIPRCKLKPFSNTDLFPLFCELLDLDCPLVNGTVDNLTRCLRRPTTVPFTSKMIFTSVCLIGGSIAIIFALVIWTFLAKRLCVVQRKRYDIMDW